MKTYFQKLKEDKPELFFGGTKGGKSDLLTDREFLNQLTAGMSEEEALDTVRKLYSPYEEPAAPAPPKEKGLEGFAEKWAKPVAQGAVPQFTPSPESDEETVAEYIRRTQPGFEKASDTGLARYRKSVLGEPGNLDTIKETLKKPAKDWLSEQNKVDAEELVAKRTARLPPVPEPEPESSMLDSAYTFAKNKTTDAMEYIASGADRAAEVAGNAGRLAESSITAGLAAGAALISETGSSIRNFTLEDDDKVKKDLRQQAIDEVGRMRQTAGSYPDREIPTADSLYGEKLLQKMKEDPAFADREASRRSSDEFTSSIIDPLLAHAADRAASVRGAPRENINEQFKKDVREAQTVFGKVAAGLKSGLSIASSAELPYMLAENVPTLLASAASGNPAAGAGVGSFIQRLGGSLAAKPPGQARLDSFDEDVESAARGAIVDGLTSVIIPKLTPKNAGTIRAQSTELVGQGVGGAASEFAADPNTPWEDLVYEGIAEMAVGGATETAPAALVRAARRARNNPVLPPEERERLKASPDPLDQATAAIDEMPVGEPETKTEPVKKELGPVDLFGQPTDLTDKSDGNVLPSDSTETISRPPSPELEAEKARIRTLYEQKRTKKSDEDAAYTQREFELEEEARLRDYDNAVNSGDSVQEAKAEKALDAFYRKSRPEPKKPEAPKAPEPAPVQQELDLDGGVQPRSTVEPAPVKPVENTVPLVGKKPKATPQRVSTKLKQLSQDPRREFTEAERGVIEQQAQAEGLPPISRASSPRRQFLRLSPEGQNAVAKTLVEDELKTTYSVDPERAKQAAKGTTAPESPSKPVSQPQPTQPTASVESVQQKPSQALSDGITDESVTQVLKDLPDGRFRQTVQDLIDEGKSPKQAFEEALPQAKENFIPVPKEAKDLATDFEFDTDNLPKDAKPLPPIKGAAPIVNAIRKVGYDVKPAKAPDTKEARHAQVVADLFGVKLNWADAGTEFNGVQSKRESIVNVKAKRPVDVVLGHEVNHVLEKSSPEYLKAIDQALTEYTNKEGLEAAETKRGKKYSPEKLRGEVRSDLLGEAVADPVFFRKLKAASKDQTTFEKIVDFIKNVVDRVIGKLSRQDSPISKQVLTDVKAFREKLLEAAKKEAQSKKEVKDTSTDFDKSESIVDKVGDKLSPANRYMAALGLSRIAKNTLIATRFQGVAQKQTAEAVQQDKFNGTAAGLEHARIGRMLDKVRNDYKLKGEEINDALRGLKTLSGPAQEVINIARAEIRRQSLIIADMIADPKLVDTITSERQLAEYLSKTYRAFADTNRWRAALRTPIGKEAKSRYDRVLDDIATALEIPADLENVKAKRLEDLAKWWDVNKGTKADKIAALEELRDQSTDAERQQHYEAIRDNLEHPEKGGNSFIEGMKTALKGADSILKETTTPQWVRDFWGEITDGGYNFIQTAERQARLISKYQVYDQLAAQMLRNGTATTRPKAGYKKIPSSMSNGPLSGLYMKEADFDFIHKSSSLGDGFELSNSEYSAWMLGMAEMGTPVIKKANSAFKVATAVFDTSTVAVQVSSSIGVGAIVAGRPPTPAELRRALTLALGEVRYDKVKDGTRDIVIEGIKLGVAGEGVISTEVSRSLKDLVERDLLADEEVSAKKLLSMGKTITRAVGGKFSTAIQFGDTFSRAMVYEVELSKQKEYYPEKSEAQQKKDAAERVRNIMPTYSGTAPIARFIASSGFMAPFMTFTWEVHRNILWNALYAASDLRNAKSPKMAAGAIARMGAVGMQVTGIAAITHWLGNQIADALGDDEEYEKVDVLDMPELVREYHDSNPYLSPIGVNKEYELSYLAPGRFNAYEPMSQVMSHALDGNFDAAADSWRESTFSQGFIGSIAAKMIAAEFVVDKDSERSRLWDQIQYEASRGIPGFLRRGAVDPIREMMEGKGFKGPEYIAEMSGMTVHKVKLPDILKSSLYDYKGKLSYYKDEAKGGVKDEAFWSAVGEPSQEDVNEIYRNWYVEKLDAFQDAYKKVSTIRKYMPDSAVRDVLGTIGLNKQDMGELMSGKVSPPTVKTGGGRGDFFEKMRETAVSRAAPENRQEVTDRWKKLEQMFLKAQSDITTEMENK